MTEGAAAASNPVGPTSAGRLLREARQAQGLHIAALATSIKVTPRKLELLETDRFDELPDATFTRALAQTVCRALKIDPAPILTLLPPLGGGHRLGSLGEGLNTPFRERPGQLIPKDWARLTSPALWGPALVLLAAAALYLTPSGIFDLTAWRRAVTGPAVGAVPGKDANVSAPTAAPEPATGASTAAEGGLPPSFTSTGIPPVEAGGPGFVTQPMPSGPITPLTSTPAAAPLAGPSLGTAGTSAAGTPSGAIQIRTTSASWVEVSDARGQSLIGRLVQPGESIGLDGTAPFKIRIGNASATRLVFRGRAVPLEPLTRDNVARLDLK
jgi:cytoskeleton protein RodZ